MYSKTDTCVYSYILKGMYLYRERYVFIHNFSMSPKVNCLLVMVLHNKGI